MRKKFLAVCLCAAMVMSFAACSGGAGNSSATGSSNATGSSSAAGGSSAADSKAESSSGTSAQASGIQGYDDLNGKTIGVQNGTTGDTYVTGDIKDGKLSKETTVERYNKGFEAVQALLQGKIDAVVIDDQPAKVFVEENKGLKILDEEYTKEDYAICLAKENTELLEKINTAIAKLKSDGTLQKIVDYYIGGKEGATPYQRIEGIARSNGTLTMATNAEFPPYEYHDNGKIVGIDADFAQAIADELSMEFTIEDMSFDSIIAAVQTGKADIGCAGMTVTEDRKKSVNFTDTYYTGRQVIIIKE